MRKYAFTLVELLAVIVLIGLMIGATSWTLAWYAKSSSRENAVNQIARADNLARIASRRLGQPCGLRLDISSQSIRGFSAGSSHGFQSTTTNVSGCKMDKILIAGEPADANSVQVPISTAGLSPSYAIRLTQKDQTGWLVFSGLTGQPTWIENEHESQNLQYLLNARHDPR
jgi:prepilin-type N-terminal cleavage/methylation domain-containing protein